MWSNFVQKPDNVSHSNSFLLVFLKIKIRKSKKNMRIEFTHNRSKFYHMLIFLHFAGRHTSFLLFFSSFMCRAHVLSSIAKSKRHSISLEHHVKLYLWAPEVVTFSNAHTGCTDLFSKMLLFNWFLINYIIRTSIISEIKHLS